MNNQSKEDLCTMWMGIIQFCESSKKTQRQSQRKFILWIKTNISLFLDNLTPGSKTFVFRQELHFTGLFHFHIFRFRLKIYSFPWSSDFRYNVILPTHPPQKKKPIFLAASRFLCIFSIYYDSLSLENANSTLCFNYYVKK